LIGTIGVGGGMVPVAGINDSLVMVAFSTVRLPV